MGTRGLWGYYFGGELKVTYNHFDSYPEALGVELIKHIKEYDRDQLVDDVMSLILVEERSTPTDEQIEKLKKWSDLSVSSGELTDWYVLLRDTQGNPSATLASGFMIDSHEFAIDSLFCEWGYVIDLDNDVFEVYEGFVKEPHNLGRFANDDEPINPADTHWYPPTYDGDERDENLCVSCGDAKDGSAKMTMCVRDHYYPVKKIAEFDLNDLPSSAEFLDAVKAASRYSEED